jgi:5-methyltetrahydrofolate corrinoid/iron sulfur protein methyltransferase
MRIIGEKINGTRKTVAAAIVNRDAEFIQNLAKKQVEGGAHWLDVNAGTHPDREVDDMLWLIDLIQGVTDVPLSLDSANPKALTAALSAVKKTPLINSISGEPDRLNNVLPIVAQHGCEVIALCMDDKGIPTDVESRMAVARKLFEATRSAGVPDEKVYIDTLVLTIATDTNAGRVTLDTIRTVRAEFPQAHISLGLSNVSFGLPVRSLVNRTFLTLAIAAGMDTAIVDPNDREMRAALLATDLLLGQDKHCLNYTRAYRKGLLEPNKQPA